MRSEKVVVRSVGFDRPTDRRMTESSSLSPDTNHHHDDDGRLPNAQRRRTDGGGGDDDDDSGGGDGNGRGYAVVAPFALGRRWRLSSTTCM